MNREKPIDVLHVFGVLDRGGAETRAVELAEYTPENPTGFGCQNCHNTG